MSLASNVVTFASTSAPAAAARAAILSAAAVRQYLDSGFIVIPGLCSAREVAQTRAILVPFFREWVGRREGRQFDMLRGDDDPNAALQPQIVDPSVFAPALLRTEYFAKLLRVARQLLGPDAAFSFDHSILKPAHSAAATPWHQDEAHHRHKYLRHRQVSFWMPLQDTPVEAGCMCYIPQSHRGPLFPHRRLNGDPRVHALECRADCFDESLAITIPIEAGSVIAHSGRTLHAALPNGSDTDRFAYIVAFTAPPELVSQTRAWTLASSESANKVRRTRWLLHGGILVFAMRRFRQGVRSSPGALWRKLRLLFVGVLGVRARAGR